MASERYFRRPYPVEPAHPMVVKNWEDLVAIYSRIRELYQTAIDQAFDEVSRQIGYVVATTIPVVVAVGEKGELKVARMGAPNLRDTLFDRMLTVALNPQPEPPAEKRWGVAGGEYPVYLIWYAALKLKLRTEWMEPAHPGLFAGMQPSVSPTAARAAEAQRQIPWFVREPAHWFDPGIALDPEEALQIQAIDQVYPDLHLAEQVTYSRQMLRQIVRPEVKEPAHFRQVEQILQSDKGPELAAELVALLRRYGY